jgi:hypothetical protein
MSFSYTLIPNVPASVDPLVLAQNAAESIALKAKKDWKFDFELNDIVTPRVLISGADAIVQRVAFRWRFFLGEWFLDQRLGVPWYQRILKKGADLRDVRQLLINVALQVPGVKSVNNFTIALNRSTRRLSITNFVIVLSDGSFARLEAPFIL